MVLKGGRIFRAIFCGVDVESDFPRAGDFLKRAILSNNGTARVKKPKFAFYKPVKYKETSSNLARSNTSDVTQHSVGDKVIFGGKNVSEYKISLPHIAYKDGHDQLMSFFRFSLEGKTLNLYL